MNRGSAEEVEVLSFSEMTSVKSMRFAERSKGKGHGGKGEHGNKRGVENTGKDEAQANTIKTTRWSDNETSWVIKGQKRQHNNTKWR